MGSLPLIDKKERNFYDTGGVEMLTVIKGKNSSKKKNSEKATSKVSNFKEGQEGHYSMDEIWKDIDLLDEDTIKPVFDPYSEIAPSLTWDNSLITSWTMGSQEVFSIDSFPLTSQQFSSGLTD